MIAAMRCSIRFVFVLLLALPAWGKYTVTTSETKTRVRQFKLEFLLPKVEGNPELAAVVAAAMKQLREKEQAAIAKYCKETDGPCEGDGAWSYRVALADDQLLSVVIPSFQYWKGAAHPSHGTETFTWTVKPPRRVSLEDLFVDRKRALQRLSKLSREQLDTGNEEWVNRGTEPKEENFRTWYISGDGFEIVFDEYQVASYAEGPQFVVIAFSEIRDLIDGKGPLGYKKRQLKR